MQWQIRTKVDKNDSFSHLSHNSNWNTWSLPVIYSIALLFNLALSKLTITPILEPVWSVNMLVIDYRTSINLKCFCAKGVKAVLAPHLFLFSLAVREFLY